MVIFLLLALNILLFFISLSIGRFNVPLIEVVKLMLGKVFHLIEPIDSTYDTIVFSIRLPRILAAMLIGAALSQSGAAYQGLFNNPLVDPYILGLSAGAGFGAAIAILMNGNYLIIELFAFGFSLLAVFLTSTISRSSKSVVTMVLSGFIVSSLFTSLISFLKYYADPYTKLPSIVYWLMGTLSQVSAKEIAFIAPIMLVSMIALYLLRWKLNILSLGTEEALSLGENPAKLRFIIVVISTVLTSLSVSISGIIGWVGLVIPHLGRMLVGPDYRKLLPTSILLGSSYLLIMDNLSRSISASEIP
ncbi:MAG: FecCD family ABC transporter permease, partial [Fervidobacterium sp.]